jgi:AraC family transcriptional regulator
MEREFEIRQLRSQKTLGARATCAHDQIGPTIGLLFGKVGPVMKELGLTMEGPPHCIYLAWRESDCDIQAGCPVSGDRHPQGEVFESDLPGCTAVVTVHKGPYDTLPDTHSACHEWINENGKQHAGSCWEVYLTDPQKEPDQSKWLTEVVYPIGE